MKKSELAIEKFDHHFYNCAQSGPDQKTVVKIATGFGVGRMQSPTNGSTNAIMIIGLKYGDNMENTYQITRDFIQEFREVKATIECMDLLDGCNLLTEEGQTYFKGNGLKQKKCKEYIRLSCEILEKIINNHS